MFLNQLHNEIRKVLWDIERGQRDLTRGAEIVNILIDEFTGRVESRDDVVSYVKGWLATSYMPAAKRMLAVIDNPYVDET